MTDEEKFLCRCACRRCTKQDEEKCKTCEYNYYDKEGKRMRLIDADALKEAMEEHTDYKGYLVCDPEEVIDLAPTIDRPHGEWIKGKEISRTMLGNDTLCIDYKDFTCSNCGLVLDRLLYHVDGSPFYKFCPNCGALMISSNSEIEKSKSEIVPDYRDGWRLREGE